MYYQVVKDCGQYKAGDVLDIGDAEYMLRIVRTTGVQLEVLDGPPVVESVPPVVVKPVKAAAEEATIPVAKPVKAAEPKPAASDFRYEPRAKRG